MADRPFLAVRRLRPRTREGLSRTVATDLAADDTRPRAPADHTCDRARSADCAADDTGDGVTRARAFVSRVPAAQVRRTRPGADAFDADERAVRVSAAGRARAGRGDDAGAGAAAAAPPASTPSTTASSQLELASARDAGPELEAGPTLLPTIAFVVLGALVFALLYWMYVTVLGRR